VWSKVESTFIADRVKEMALQLFSGEFISAPAASLAAVNKADATAEEQAKTVLIGVDVTGVGSGTCDILKADFDLSMNSNVAIYEINFGAAALKDKKFVNLISEARRLLANQINSKDGFILPKNHILMGELVNRRYKIDSKSRYWTESKEDYKGRTDGKSPDQADALKIAWYNYSLYEAYGTAKSFQQKPSSNATAFREKEF
jgi:hypothetical protein